MDWIKMGTNLDSDPRVLRVAAAVGIDDVDVVIGKLWRLWSIADEHTVDGVIRHMTPAVLDRRLGVPGFAAALEQVDWLAVTDAGLVIPRFEKHNGASAKRRAQDARRQQGNRAADKDADKPKASGDTPPGVPGPKGRQASTGDTVPPAQNPKPVRSPSADRPQACGRNATESVPRTRREEDLKDEDTDNATPGAAERTDPTPTDAGTQTRYFVPSPVFEDLYARIREVTREADTRANRSLYWRYTTCLGVAAVELALSSTKDRNADMRQGPLRRPGAYMNQACRLIAVDRKIDLTKAPTRAVG